MNQPKPISIWQPQIIDGALHFVRPEPAAYGDHYATRLCIPAAKAQGTRRLCFFGESVAAGYLFTPALTCAQVLEQQLNWKKAEWEVVDLARTNETLGTLADTVEASMQLDPDLIVLFVGNNWDLLETPRISPYFPDPEARKAYGRILIEGGIDGVMEAGITQQVLGAEAALARIREAGGDRPVLVLLPEVNLVDWPALQPPLIKDAGSRLRWYTLQASAQSALQENKPKVALKHALRMLEIDEGRCPTTYRLIGDAWLAQDEDQKALRAHRAEVDCESYSTMCFLGSPRAGTPTRKVLTRACRQHGMQLVDLQQVFATHQDGLPDRRMFLDYCHLTLEGIHVAMAALSAQIMAMDTRLAVATLPTPQISAEAEAVAWLGTALHTAHRLPDVARRSGLLTNALQAAYQCAPGIANTMVDLVEARATRLPAVLTEAQERNFLGPYRLSMQHGWQYNHMDIELIQHIEAFLLDNEPALAGRIPNILLHHRGLSETFEELADPFYLWEPLMQYYPEIMQQQRAAAALKSPWPHISFALICTAAHDVALHLVARHQAGFPVTVEVNGSCVASPELSRTWRICSIHVPRDVLNHGINKVTIVWSPNSQLNRETPEARLQRGDEAHLHTIFGEVFSLKARLSTTRHLSISPP